jgi:hypothetical protein
LSAAQPLRRTGHGVQTQDVDVLKLLYLVRYIDDIKATLDNLVILMADDIRVDKVTLREAVRDSLDRLMSQNYIGRTGDAYNFLTDEEQDIQREIKNTPVDTSSIVERIAYMVYGDIYTTKKYRHDSKYDFAFDQMVDGVTVGAMTGGMRLRFLTVATDAIDKSEMRLMAESSGQAIVVLADTSYYESLESAMKIRKYVKQRNVAQLPKSVQDIIRDQQDEATAYESSAMDELKKAIDGAAFYVDGEHLDIKSGDAKSKIDQALEYLVSHVYSELDLVTKFADTDEDIYAILSGTAQTAIGGLEPNRDAAAKIEEYLEMQHKKKMSTSMFDVQSRFQSIPYGWKEIDIAAVMAQLIYNQKVTVKYAGTTIQPGDKKLPDMLRKKSEVGKTIVSKRISIEAPKMKEVREFLREYFDVMDVPTDEDGLVQFITQRFGAQKQHYDGLLDRYVGHKYPDLAIVQKAVSLVDDILSQQKDNVALIDRVVKLQDDLDDSKEAMQNIEGFFKNQVQVFDAAVKMEADLSNELDYLAKEEAANKALNQIRLMLMNAAQFDYAKIPELNALMVAVRDGHNRLLDAKREELSEIVRQCLAAIHTAGADFIDTKSIITTADNFYTQQKQKIQTLQSLALLDGLIPPMIQYKDTTVDKIEIMTKPIPPKPPVDTNPPEPPKKKLIKAFNRQVVFPAKRLESDADIDAYIDKMREQLKNLMKNCDGIELK